MRDLYLGLGCGVDWANYYGESEAGSHPMVYGNLSREVERLAASCLHEEGRDDRRRLSCLPAILRAFLLIGAGGFLERGKNGRMCPRNNNLFFIYLNFVHYLTSESINILLKNGSGHTPTNLSTAHIIAAKLQ